MSDAGIIKIGGSSASTSVGTTVTIQLTPTMSAAGQITWLCQAGPGVAVQFKYVPAECRH